MKELTAFIVNIILHCFLNEAFASDPLASYNVVYGWKMLDFKFPSEQSRNRMISSGEYIPKNNVITGVKVRGNMIYMTVPRWRTGVPASLVYVEFESDATSSPAGEPKGPLLNPFPSWKLNELGNCHAFQYVQSVEIDQYNRMWIIDVGRVNIFGNKTNDDQKCPAKLAVVNLSSHEVIHKYEFPPDVVSPSSNFLNDLVVACESEKDCFIYISDALDAKIVVYNYAENRSWFVHHSTMLANPSAKNITILGSSYEFNVNIDGIAISPKDQGFDRLYYCPLSSLNIYSVPTSKLKTAVNGDNISDGFVKNEGRKSSQSDGLAMDANGLLFYGLLGKNGVAYFNVTPPNKLTDNEVLLIQNDNDLQWPDTLGFDESGYLYVASNRLQRFKGDKFEFTETNFRIIRTYTGSQSYMQSAASRNKATETETIAPALYEATPATNLDDKEKASMQPTNNSSRNPGIFTEAVLLIIMTVFVLHPIEM